MSLSTTLKPKQCAMCPKEFMPARLMQQVCSPLCASRKVRADKKQERATTKARKEKLVTTSDLIKLAQREINKAARLRDLLAGKGCISCGARPAPKFGGSMDAGHFRSVGSAPHLRFFLPQIRLQCVKCNRYLGGNAVEFRKGLVAERGREWVEWVESLQAPARPRDEYLHRLIKVMRKRNKRLEKRYAMRG